MNSWMLLMVITFASECCISTSGQTTDDKVWLFAGNGRRKPYFYLDDFGELRGFNVDLTRAVCAVANKKCDFVLAEFTHCSYTQREINYPGEGLMSGWFDACPGYAITPDRQNAFDFTDPYSPGGAHFAVAPGNPKGFDPTQKDFTSFTLTHLTGAPTNGQCLSRLGKKFGNIIVAANLPDAMGLLLNGTAAALFVPRDNITGLDVLPQEFHCDSGGTGTMVKKGSSLPQWWNPAFKVLALTGAFDRLCQQARVTYDYDIGCLSFLGGNSTVATQPKPSQPRRAKVMDFLIGIHRQELQSLRSGDKE